MTEDVTICIPTRNVWDGIRLTIESILRRTPDGQAKVLVCDNSLSVNSRSCEPKRFLSPGEDDGNRRDYLRALAAEGRISYIENTSQGHHYGHGENITLMLDRVDTKYALLFNSTSEILRPDWISVLTNLIIDQEKDIGVARFRAGGAREHDYITPSYWPNIMLLNVPLLRQVFPESRWELEQIGFEDFHRQELFPTPPSDAERNPPLVFCDTAWRLWEKLEYDNPIGARMRALPDNYWNIWIQWLGGIDRNSHRPGHPFVVSTLGEINRRLAALLGGKNER